MADNKTLSDVIDRLKAEGTLTRNSGTHSLKSIKEILINQHKESLSDKEEAREQGQQAEKQTEAIVEMRDILKGASTVGSAKKDEGGGLFGGLASGLGGLLGGAGLGVGVGAAGLGILAWAGSELIDSIAALDSESIKTNITNLLSIGKELEAQDMSLWKDGGTFAVTMTGIGLGLAAFGLGAGGNALVQAAVDKFGVGDWATKVKDNVKELLSIKDELGGNLSMLADGGTFAVTMTGIGLGLAAFGIGSGVAALTESIAKFSEMSGEGSWSAQMKAHVVNLLSIKDELGGNLAMLADGGTFMVTMAGISAGLVAFGFGSAAVGFGETIAKFSSISGEGSWSQQLVAHVKTLLGLKDELGGNVSMLQDGGAFGLTMGGIGAGLVAFGFGSATTGVAEALNKFTGNDDWAQTIKDRVKTLVSITDELSDGDGEGSKAGKFTAAMAKISAGLVAFAGGEFVGTMSNAVTAVMSLFGADSPMDQLKQLANDADDLEKAGDALEKISDGLDKFASIRVSTSDYDFEGMAKNLMNALPFIRKLSSGGTYDPWGPGDYDFGPERGPGRGGLLDPDLNLEALARAATNMGIIFNGGPMGGTPGAGLMIPPGGGPTVERLQTIQQFQAENLGAAQGANGDLTREGAGGGNNVVVGGTNVDNRSVTNMNQGVIDNKQEVYSRDQIESLMMNQGVRHGWGPNNW